MTWFFLGLLIGCFLGMLIGGFLAVSTDEALAYLERIEELERREAMAKSKSSKKETQ